MKIESEQEVMSPAMMKLAELKKARENPENAIALMPNRLIPIVDTSGSMGEIWDKTTRMKAAKSAMNQIIAASDSKTTQFGLITFESQSWLIHPMGTPFARLIGTDFISGGGTSLLPALELSKSQNPNRLIILTDGGCYDALQCLDAAKSYFAPRQIKIDTVAIGEANDEFLVQLSAITNGTFSRADTPEQLKNIFLQLEPKNYLMLEHKA